MATKLRTASTDRGTESNLGAGSECGEQLAGILLHLVDCQHDKGLGEDVLKRDAVGVRKRMSKRQPQTIGRDFDDLGVDCEAVAQVGYHHDGDIQFAADQEVFDIVAAVFDGMNLD